MNYRIERYRGGRDEHVAAMVLAIQNDEQGLHLTTADQPDLENITEAYGEGGFWIALDDNDAVNGTIGLLRYGDTQAALKKFFIPAAHRGPAGPAKALFEHLMAFAREQGIEELFLDTPAAATRSHGFYRKAGFEEIDRATLPAGYKFPDRGSVIFRLKL
jgi:N-acetylglutamate synthase-like GNAT family acetyltransferase